MRSLCYVDGQWLEGNPPIIGAMSHAAWMASTVFDGARAFEGTTPDLDLHCQRLVDSAVSFGLDPILTGGEIEEIAREGIAQFDVDASLYVRPMFWAESGFVVADPESTRFCCAIHEAPMPQPKGTTVLISRYRRPGPDQAPTQSKAACLYPNAGRALGEAQRAGYGNAVVLDGLGNVAELATANIWMAKDGVAVTPIPNGCFLNGITRQRVAQLLRLDGIAVQERTISVEELIEADELFSTGNWGKVIPITRILDRDLQAGPIYRRARELYWDYAHGRL